MPPAELRRPAFGPDFAPAPDVASWIRETFQTEGRPLHNPEHRHLARASIGVLWTNVVQRRQMRLVLATAEQPLSRASAWQKARHDMQLFDWFREIPDFLITLYAPKLSEVDNATWCAVIEHELYHCAQARDAFGLPKFGKDGPIYAIRGHDSEEFIGVVRRYGARDVGTQLLIEAARETPLMSAADIAGACGTCLKVAA